MVGAVPAPPRIAEIQEFHELRFTQGPPDNVLLSYVRWHIFCLSGQAKCQLRLKIDQSLRFFSIEVNIDSNSLCEGIAETFGKQTFLKGV